MRGIASYGAHAIVTWIDELDPATAERVARILTDRASHSVFAQARARAAARLADGQAYAQQPHIAAAQGISVTAFRKLVSVGRADRSARAEGHSAGPGRRENTGEESTR